MGNVVRGYTVVIAQIPLSLELDNAVVSCPTYNGIKDDTLVSERTVGIVANGIAQEVAIASRVREVVLSIIFMHPRCFEEAVWITSLQGLSILIENDDRACSLGKAHHIVAHANNIAGNSWSIRLGKELSLVVGSRTEVDETIVVAVLAGDRFKAVIERAPPLQLSTPEAAEVAVNLSIVILEHAGVDGEGATDGLCLRYEGTFRLISNSYAKVENTVIAFGREDEVVFSILLDNIIVPHLLLGPGHILDIKNHTMVGDLTILQIVEGEHMVVLHLEVSTIIVETLSGIPVVAGIDIELTVKHIG